MAFISHSVRRLISEGRASYVPLGQELQAVDVDLPAPRIFGSLELAPVHQAICESVARYSVPLMRTYRVDACRLVGPHLVCFTEDGFVAESTRGSKSFRNRELFRRGEFEGTFSIAAARSERLDGCHLVVGGKAGYYHWLTEILPRLVYCSRVFDLKRLPVLLRSTSAPYAEATLRSLGIRPAFSDSPVITVDSAVLPTHLVHHKRLGRYSPELSELLRYYRDRFVHPPRREYPARIYVSRADAPSRRVENEDEVCRVLDRFGFQRVVLSELPFEEQVGLFKHAKFVVGPHGAGLTNVLFCEPGTRLLEFYGEHFRAPSPFRNLAQLQDVEYAMLLCAQGSAPPWSGEPVKDADLIIDCDQLERAMTEINATPHAAGLPRKSYAQNGEDLLTNMLLGGRRPITYVDIGCLYPDLHSNTYLHYLAGGHGVCIDANPDVGDRFRKVRPRDTFVNAGVSERDETLDYFMHRNPVFNTFSQKQAEKVARKAIQKGSAGRELVRKIQVPVKPLMTILSDLQVPEEFIADLDLLSVDVEGLENDVMKGIDFARFRPKLVVAEAILEKGKSFRDVGELEFVRRLEEMGYVISAYTGHDVYLTRKR